MLKDVGYSDVSTDITEFKHTSYDLFRTLNIHEDISGMSVSIFNFCKNIQRTIFILISNSYLFY